MEGAVATTNTNGFRGAVQQQGSVQADALVSRAAQEVQAAVAMAKRFPRNEHAAVQRITTACRRMKLAEKAFYSYPRGTQTVTGPTIRLAETLAQLWGNIAFGITELEQRDGESDMMAYAWDMETNVRQDKIFTVKHERHSGRGVTNLKDPRDIYEVTANNGSRRLRACILGVIPSDVVELAEEECEKTLRGTNSEPLVDRVRKMLEKFGEVGVTHDMIEKRLSHKLEAISETEWVQLRKIYNGIKDGASKREDWFALGPPRSSDADKAKQMLEGDKKPEASAPEKPKVADEKANAETIKAIQAEANELGHDQASLDKLAKECGASRFSTIRQQQAEALLRRLKGEPE